MRTVFNALASRLTPGAGRDPGETDSVDDDASVHGNVTLNGIAEEEKSSRDPDEAGRREQFFSDEFNEEQSPRTRRGLTTGFIGNGVSLTDPEFVYQSSGDVRFPRESLHPPQRHNDEGRKSVTDPRLHSNRELGATDSRFSPHGTDRLFQLTDPHFGFGGSDRRVDTSLSNPLHGDLIPHREPVTYEDTSVRVGRREVQNVTERDTKRPRDRPKDMDYRRRFSISDLPVNFIPPPERHSAIRESQSRVPSWPDNERASGGNVVISDLGRRGVVRDGRIVFTPVPSVLSPNGAPFGIKLIHMGQEVLHQVRDRTLVSRLAEEAGAIFGLDPEFIVVMICTPSPEVLDKRATLAGPPRVFPNVSVYVCFVRTGAPPNYTPPPMRVGAVDHGIFPQFQQGYEDQGAHDLGSDQGPLLNSKLLGTFKLPKFDGSPRHWKSWDKAFERFLGLHQLDHVLDADFLLRVPLSQKAYAANKVVYFLLEDAVAPGSMAAKYVRQACKHNGHEAYEKLRNGYVFSGPQTATVLLGALSNIRLLRDESPSAFCLRLIELIEDLELIPGSAAVFMGDTQKLGYLLSAIRHEKDLQSVYSQLQSDQLRGTITFEQACLELHHRCDAIRADEILDTALRTPGKNLNLLSTEDKRKNRKGDAELVPCLSKECVGMIVAFLPFCKACYLQCMAGKTPTIELKNGFGKATYNSKTMRIDFPSTVPASRLPQVKKDKANAGEKSLVAHVASYLSYSSSTSDHQASVLFYVDSGAGQCLCSCSAAFV